MVGAGAGGRGPQIDANEDREEVAEVEKARERMIARHKLIEAMIHNNHLQLRNESARGGAEIERACALRDAGKPGADDAARAEVERMARRLRDLDDERGRLVAEREWLNASLLEYESGPSSAEHGRAGHA